LLVKGEISGAEDLLIDGAVEGVVRLNERKLTIGPAARLTANITAGDVLVKGNVKGNVSAKGRIEIGNEASVTGDLRTRRVFIASGAWFKGLLEIERNPEKATDENALGTTNSAPAKVRAAAAGVTNI
jgi:cytoskeletal protein CcmA (bactofilin family)